MSRYRTIVADLPSGYAREQTLAEENARLREALQVVIDECTDWSNDDIRDHCRAALARHNKGR